MLPPTKPKLWRAALRGGVLACCLWSVASQAEISRNQTVIQALEWGSASGVEVIYSSDLIRPWMRVRETPTQSDIVSQLREVLQPYGLTLGTGPHQTLLVVRDQRPVKRNAGAIAGQLRFSENGLPVGNTRLVVGERPVTTDANGVFHISSLPPGRYVVSLETEALELTGSEVAVVSQAQTTTLDLTVASRSVAALEEVLVSASQYRLMRTVATSTHAMDATQLHVLPDLGDDPIRAVARLPGTAGNAFSGKVNVRGGETGETLVRFDGLRLYNPFHLKDFNSLFSSIDPGVVESINVYTGGFPVGFGDRMSGVIDIDPLQITQQPRRELSVSFFNSSALLSGTFDNDQGQWLVSARRGHLDQVLKVIDPKLGTPRYSDYYARGSHQLTPSLSVTGSYLLFSDDIKLSDGDDEELASARYRDRYHWLRFDYDSGKGPRGSVQLAHSDLTSRRNGQADQSGVSSGWLDDRRDFSISSINTDWHWALKEGLSLSFGADYRRSRGSYQYSEAVEFAVLLDTPGAWTAETRQRELALTPSGEQVSAYVNARLLTGVYLTLDAGLRWDRETLTAAGGDQLSPRVSALFQLPDKSSLRASWGRYFQAQSIDELQVSDGLNSFAAAQRADHWVLGYERSLGEDVFLRIEAYHKDYRGLRPRYENLLNSFVLLPELKPDRVLVAPQSAQADGLELSLSSTGNGPWRWWSSYSLSSARDEIDGQTFRRGWENRRQFRAGIARQGARWDFSVAGWYASGWPTTDIAIDEAQAVIRAGTRNASRLGRRSSVDVRLARRFKLTEDSTLTAFVEISNALDRTNPCCVEFEFEADAEDGVAELELESESVRDLPFFPSVGLVWRF